MYSDVYIVCVAVLEAGGDNSNSIIFKEYHSNNQLE